ncbi:histidine kinase [Pseudonocardia sp. KRD-184]|uniref:histidine kinase n=1 Tax=Pseudonocardia oceani TaxID=2792013 RepID=A0ABS6UC27_9PSEU|nr:ATP-binding protein [Pseudonocardia oceani]MBW0088510.1 histidine kinase [Pseudonocardia oceani]MBW0095436.1 histidine kinase [Pseudonocardia oceani]MBW0108081.1 histidine kinase [Pseudonocardia oceani]MBW0122023.1 histidine kinase [Pseudonocardia oceani]MBW0129803.1 histidine kinase [Pseudonocardia oceani]
MSSGSAAAGRRFAVGGYVALLIVCTAVAVGWLAVGLVVAVARYWPGALDAVRTAAAGGSRWAQGVSEAAPRSEPLDQAVLDYAFSALNLVIAAVLLRHGKRSWSLRLLVIAMIGSAGAFNLQAHAAAVAVQIATGWSVGQLHQIVLHGVASTAYVLALLVFPTVSWSGRLWRGPAGNLLVAVGVASLLVVGFGTALLPHTYSCILFFGFLVPVAGLVVLPARVRRGATSEQRTQARLLLSVLAAAFATAAVLAVVTLVLTGLGEPGLTLYDPTAHVDQDEELPTALLFWFSRLASAAIATAVLLATVGARLGTAEQLFSRGLAATLVAALAGGAFTVVRAAAGDPAPTGAAALGQAALAAVPVALVFLPLYLSVENLVDRLLYGTRPTPYSVLAEVAALSHATAGDAPDLARVAEGVARALGAGVCRLTVRRPGLRDRTYSWPGGAEQTDPGDLVAVSISQGEEQLGEIAVDRAAVAGLHAQRRHLLDDVADSLRVVLQASRSGIELERQLRAALAHGEAIAVARREAVAEMDSERRRIERDLHDGAQHHLVTLGLTLGLVDHQVATRQLDDARERLARLLVQVDDAETVLAETATGVSSVVLSEQGLAAALSAALAGAHPPVALDCTGAPAARLPAEIGDTAYYCCLEAVNNARKHAPGVPVTVSVSEVGGSLRMAVRDSGPGFEPGAVPASAVRAGRGLRNVTARVAAVGGTIAIRSAPGEGTTVEWSLPLPQEPLPQERLPQERLPSGGGPGTGDGMPLAARLRDLLRYASEVYRGTDHVGALHGLAARLDAGGRTDRAGRPDVVEVRRALAALEDLVRSAPLEGDRTHRLRYELDRLRSGAHELAEVDLAATLRAGDLTLPEEVRRSAERLLGAGGAEPRARLGLAEGADAHEVRVAATAELARWQWWAAHPASTGGVRDAAQVVVRTCERLLAEAGPG